MKRLSLIFWIAWMLLGCRSLAGAPEIIEQTVEVEKVIEQTVEVEIERVVTKIVEGQTSAEIQLLETPRPVLAEITGNILYQGTLVPISMEVWVNPASSEIVGTPAPVAPAPTVSVTVITSSTITPTLDAAASSVTVYPTYYRSDFKPRCYELVASNEYVDTTADGVWVDAGDRLCQLSAEADFTPQIDPETITALAKQHHCPNVETSIRGGIVALVARESEYMQYAVNQNAIGVLQLDSYWFYRYWQDFRVPLVDVFDLENQFRVGCWVMRTDARAHGSGNALLQWSSVSAQRPTLTPTPIPTSTPTLTPTPAPTPTVKQQVVTVETQTPEQPTLAAPSVSTPIANENERSIQQLGLRADVVQSLETLGCTTGQALPNKGYLCLSIDDALVPRHVPTREQVVEWTGDEGFASFYVEMASYLPVRDNRWFSGDLHSLGVVGTRLNYFDFATQNPFDAKTNVLTAHQQYKNADWSSFWREWYDENAQP
ncbi:MAG: hypothetical protein ACPG8W_22010 [Candidatus Promineifilaceae bacterium]